jgi:hypothetical protein
MGQAGINKTGFFVLLSAVQFSSGSQTKQSEEPLVIYPQKGCQPDQNPGFYTTGLVLANQHRNLDALNLKIALESCRGGNRSLPGHRSSGAGWAMEEKAGDQRMEGRGHDRSRSDKGVVVPIFQSRSRNRIGPGTAGCD